MDSTSASTLVASFQFQEIDYFVMVVMMAFLGWRISEMVRLHFKKLAKSNVSKSSHEILMPQQKDPAAASQMKQKGNCRIPPTQTLAARATVPKSASSEQLVSKVKAMPGLQPPPGLPLSKAPASQAVRDAPWRQESTSTSPVATRDENMPRQLGRVVVWKETGYGFVVDEAGVRLFARQAEVEGGEQLRPGQLIMFRRGKTQTGQAAKALNITIVSQEEARMMRQTASTGSAISSANKALAFPSALKKEVAAAPPKIAATVQKSSDSGTDDDLCAFLGAGSKEEQIKNLKYAPQWVADKFWSQQAQQQQ